MEKFINIAGPCNPARHYMLPATERLPDLLPREVFLSAWLMERESTRGKTK